ncbi:hypothetical protein HBA54_14830 [Pelagibius litoralis]|uniref:Uncharacterized protein n=1 Tax=Pelagibius litoralis TaxID=374515 RepID=A0A967EYP8_9PROT|nr:hypothetical protein [Pelagibius litoralis]NIA69877.1 hypothetical protein [Pelagibius litoralis]
MAITNYPMASNGSTSATPASLRHMHRRLMLSRIQAEPGVSRAELAGGFGFSEMASTRIAHDLLAARIIEEFDHPEAGAVHELKTTFGYDPDSGSGW